MKFNWRTEWPLWLILGAMFLAGALSWSSLPETLPIHWGLSGRPDRFGGRFEALLLFPLLGLFVYLMMTFLPRIDPGRANYPTFAGAFHLLRLAVLLFLASLYAAMHLAFRGHPVNMNSALLPLTGLLFILLGNVMGKFRPNWFVGIRTPWTLTSKQAWVRTHRLGGWVFVFSGVLLMVAGLVNRPWFLLATFALFITSVIGISIYSYFVWKSDPDKMPPAGTRPA